MLGILQVLEMLCLPFMQNCDWEFSILFFVLLVFPGRFLKQNLIAFEKRPGVRGAQ